MQMQRQETACMQPGSVVVINKRDSRSGGVLINIYILYINVACNEKINKVGSVFIISK